MSKSIIDEERLAQIALNSDDLARYSRHLLLPELKAVGQRRIKAARVLCIGAGGLGSPAALYLGAAGVGTIGFVDFDRVDISNLQRQVLYGTNDVGRQKLEAASERIRDTNPNVVVVSHECRFTSENAQKVIAPYDVVIDGSDNFPTRYLSNDVCVFARKPNIYGSASGRTVLPLPVSGAATAGSCTQLRRSRRARRIAGHHRIAAGHGGIETDHRRG